MLKNHCLALAALVALAVPALPVGAHAAETVVHVYNWSDYIADDTLARFEKETGIKVVYDVYDKNEVLETKLLTGRSGYDVVFPSLKPFAERLIRSGVLQPLDKSKLKNLGNLDSAVLATMAEADPGNRHVLPYMWGTTGLGYNVAKVKAALGPNAPVDSWRLVFEPENARKLAGCGISFLDDDEALAAVLIHLGKSPHSTDALDLAAAETAFRKIRPYVKHFHSSQYIDQLANGDICVAHGYSGDVIQARNRAREAKNNVEIAYAIPREGAVLWIDVMAVPKDAPHPNAAHAFIDFLLMPDVIAAISNKIAYANGNRAATPLVAAAVRNDPSIYPPPAVKERLLTLKVLPEAARRARVRAWTRIKTGQ